MTTTMPATKLGGMRQFALTVARQAGELACAAFSARSRAADRIQAKGPGIDLVTSTDHACEELIVEQVLRRYPGHAVLAEESGEHGPPDAEYRWLVDPLDGTHNFVAGLPLFGVCLTLLHDDQPVLAVVHDSPRKRSRWAIRGEGAWDGAERLKVSDPPRELRSATVSWIQGYAVPRADPVRLQVLETLETHCKRTLVTWAPSQDWGLLASGGTDALLAYRNSSWDLEPGLLLVEEAGGQVVRTPELVLAGVPSTVRALLPLVGLSGSDRGPAET